MTFISHAQNFEDVMLWRALSSIERGFYIDVGASEPLADSVTAAFYERGWSGINIEPMSGAFGRLAAARQRDTNLQLALEEAPGTASYFSIDDGNGISTGVPELANKYKEESRNVDRVTVTVSTLRAVCEAHVGSRPIHFLKIDVEGKERAVLSGGDFSRFRPWIVLIEATLPNSQIPTHHEWEELLLKQAYVFLYFDGLNRFYAAREKLELLQPHFSTPPNWFDHFMRASEAHSNERTAEAEAATASLAEKLRQAESGLAKIAAELQAADAGWRLEKSAREALEQRLSQSRSQQQQLLETAATQAGLSRQMQQALQRERDELDLAKTAVTQLERANDALSAQVDAYTQETFESSRHIAWLSHERIRVSERLSQSEGARQATVEDHRRQVDLLESLRMELRGHEAALVAQVAAIRSTVSWRVTRPLRWVRRMFASHQ